MVAGALAASLGNWSGWYDAGIPIADKRYRDHIAELDTREYE